jgi:hypothetical protein
MNPAPLHASDLVSTDDPEQYYQLQSVVGTGCVLLFRLLEEKKKKAKES